MSIVGLRGADIHDAVLGGLWDLWSVTFPRPLSVKRTTRLDKSRMWEVVDVLLTYWSKVYVFGAVAPSTTALGR